jgi:hypothetical protein
MSLSKLQKGMLKEQRREELTSQESHRREEIVGYRRGEETVDPAVTDRMLSRVFIFAGVPVAIGLLLFPMFWYLKVWQYFH